MTPPAIDPTITVDDFEVVAKAWLDEHATPRPDASGPQQWGEGEFSVAVFHAMDHDVELDYIANMVDWVQLKATCGFHAITEPVEYGGLGLSRRHARAFGRLERQYVSHGRH